MYGSVCWDYQDNETLVLSTYATGKIMADVGTEMQRDLDQFGATCWLG